MPAELPEFVEPMLARIGAPFDSAEHLFEIKWDGIRALGFIEAGTHRLFSRRRNELTPRYPELAFLSALEPGTLLDGELVVLVDGKPSFPAVMQREHARKEMRIEGLRRTAPVSYVVFDVLYRGGRSVMQEPLTARREHLAELLAGVDDPHLVRSEGVEGEGLAFFDGVLAQGLEGMVAKRLASSYQPGRRTGDWTKIKQVRELHCLVLGYVPDGEHGLKSLIIGAPDEDGNLRCVGKVGSGLTAAVSAELFAELQARLRDTPLIEGCGEGRWVEPGLFCTVNYLEFTRDGNLRAPVFGKYFTDPQG